MSDHFENHFEKISEESVKNIPFPNFLYNLFNALWEIVYAIRDLKKVAKPAGIIHYRIDISSNDKIIDNNLFTAHTDYEIVGCGCSYVSSQFSGSKEKIKLRLFDYTINNFIGEDQMELSTYKKSFKVDKKVGNISVGHTIGVQIESDSQIKPFDLDVFIYVKERD